MVHDPESLLSVLRGGGLLTEAAIEWICSACTAQLLQCPNVLSLRAPVTVCGDVHGQYHDLTNLFLAGGPPSATQYLFLGDLVDRGSHSVEVLLTLLLHSLQYPGRFHVLRGNHESRRVSATYGFYDECLRKYGSATVWTRLTDLFDYLPIAAVIDQSVFAVHGGLSPHLPELAHIELIDRVREIPQDGGPLADLMWSDPADEHEIAKVHFATTASNSKQHKPRNREAEADSGQDDEDETGQWAVSPRGGGYLFGAKATQHFLHRNGLSWMVRSHQLCLEGWRTDHHDRVLTVWSAPNYCYRCGNTATVALVAPAAASETAKAAYTSCTYKLSAFHKAQRQEEEAERALVDYFL